MNAEHRQEDLAPRTVRELAGWPKHRMAIMAGVGIGLVTLYEADPGSVADRFKREKLARIYADLRSLVS